MHPGVLSMHCWRSLLQQPPLGGPRAHGRCVSAARLGRAEASGASRDHGAGAVAGPGCRDGGHTIEVNVAAVTEAMAAEAAAGGSWIGFSVDSVIP